MTNRQLTTEELRLLAGLERRIDRGEIPFVNYAGRRFSVREEVMTELGLERGQTISDPIFKAILDMDLAHITTEIALEKAKKPQPSN